MPKMVLNRNYVLRAEGRDAAFVKGEAVEVHPYLVRHALGIGAEMADGSSVDVLPAEVNEAPQLSVEDRKKAILATIEKLALRNQRGDFTASGLPDLRVLNGLMDIRVDRKELETVFNDYVAAK